MPLSLRVPAVFLIMCGCLTGAFFGLGLSCAVAQLPLPNTTGSARQGIAPEEGDSEEQMEVSDQIRVRISPLHHGRIIDKITGDATVSIFSPQGKFTEVYAQPVDAPYGGMPLEEPALIGERIKLVAASANVVWRGPNPHRYYRIFAVVFKNSKDTELPLRSPFVSVGIAGKRLCEGVSSVK